MVLIGISPSGTPDEGYVAVDPATREVAGFVAARPEGPVPDNEIPADEALRIAEDFARRHHPELFADGGEVSTSIDETITPLGARMVHLQRTTQGVLVPTLADVGVRVYDGKVVYFRRKHVPLAEGIELPGAVTEEEARKTAVEKNPAGNVDVLLIFDAVHEVTEVRRRQRNVWSIWMEVRSKGRQIDRVEAFLRQFIDANTGEWCYAEPHQPNAENVARYRAGGGERPVVIPQEPAAFADARPVWSPGGAKIAFLSTRPRPGYPSWIEGTPGLFVVIADGSELRCLVPADADDPCWSPDGNRIAYVFGGKLHLVLLTGGEPEVLAAPQGHEYGECAWVDADRLVLSRREGNEGFELVLLDLTQPETEAKVLTPESRHYDSYTGLAVAPDGASVVYTAYGFEAAGDTWDLLRADLSGSGGEPEVLCKNPRAGIVVQWAGPDRLLVWDNRPGEEGLPMWMLQLGAAEPTEWRPPTPSVPGADPPQTLMPDDVCFSPDGKRLAFSARATGGEPDPRPTTLIWTCALDGTDLKQVTPWEGENVAMVDR